MSDTRYVVESGFYDAINHDRVYSADQMNEPYKMILTEGVVEGGFAVTQNSPAGMSVLVAPGNALLGGKWASSKTQKILTVPDNTSMYGRYDAVVLQVDTNSNVREASIVYRTGTPAAEPAVPTLINSGGISEVMLAYITVAAGATSISTSYIHDTRGGSDCPYVMFQIGSEQIENAVEVVLADHPEWTTTVQDGSITLAKFASGVIDNTLSQAGAAADAKATGDALAALNNDLSELNGALNTPNNNITIDIDSYTKTPNTRYITESGDLHLVSGSNDYADTYKIDLTEYIGYSVRIKKVSGLNSGFYTVTSMCDNDGYQPMRWHTIESLLYAYDEWVLPITSDYPYLFLSKTHNAVVSVEIIMGAEQFYNPQKLYKGYLNLYGIETETNTTTRFHTDYIPCPENTKIYYMGENNHSSICAVAFYDSQFNFISGVSNGGSIGSWLSTTSPTGTKYARISAVYEKPWGIKIPLFGTNASPAQNKTIFVSSSGNDNNDGLTRASAVRSIQKAIDLNGKYILVKEGSYSSFTLENKSNVHISLDNEYSAFVAGTDEDFPKILIDSNNNETISVLVKNCADITLENIEVKNANVSGFKVQRSVGIIFTDCVAHDIATETPSNGNAGFEIVYSDCIFNNCVAYNIGIATTPTSPTYHVDGFNMHGTGNTIFNDCSAWNCIDDGISHHDACTGTINGGEWYRCGKGGVASPTHGAKVNIYNVYAHDNMYGLYAGNSDAVTDRGNIIISNSIFLDNTEKDMYMDSYYHGFALNCIRQTVDATNFEFIGGSIPA